MDLNPDQAAEPPLATAWPRYWARSLDILIEVFVVGIGMGLLMPLFVASSPLFQQKPYEWVLLVLTLPLVILLDAAIATAFGNTFGKWLVGIKVVAIDGGKLSFGRLLKRNAGMLWWGLGLGIPIVSILTLVFSRRALNLGDEMKWDLANETRVLRPWGPSFRVVAAPVIMVLLTLVSLGLQQATSPRKTIADLVSSVQAESPQMLDSAIRLDGADDGPGLALTYRYTMVNVTNLTHDIAGVREYVVGLTDDTRFNSCNDATLRSLLSAGATLRYWYRDANGATLHTIEVKNDHCNREGP